MSLEELQSDMEAIAADIAKMDLLTSASDLVKFLQANLWPFVESVVSEMKDMDEALEDVVNDAIEVISRESAGIIVAPILAAEQLVDQLEKLIPTTAIEQLKAIRLWRKMSKDAKERIDELVVDDGDEDELDDESIDGEEG